MQVGPPGETGDAPVHLNGYGGFAVSQLPYYNSAIGKLTAEIRLSDIERMTEVEIDLSVLKAAGVVQSQMLQAKLIKSGELTRKISIKGVGVTKGAREAILAAGGSVAE